MRYLIFTIFFIATVVQAQQKTELLMQHGHHKKINLIRFSPDGSFFATAADDKLIILTETKTGIAFQTIRIHRDRPINLVFSPDGKKMISGDSKEVIIYDLDRNKVQLRFDKQVYTKTFMMVSPDSKIVYIDDDGYDLATGKKIEEPSDDLMDDINIYTPDGSKMLFIRNEEVHVWDMTTNTLKFTLGTQQKPRCFYVTRDNRYYYCANEYGNWQQWSLSTGKLEGTREGKKDNRESISENHFMLVNDQHTLFATQNHTHISVYDLWTGRLLQKIQYTSEEDETDLTAASFSPEGNVLICATNKEGSYRNRRSNITRVRYIDTKSGRTIRETKGFDNEVKSIGVSPDEKHISIMGEQATRIWEMDRAGGRLFPLCEATYNMTNPAWSPDSKVIYFPFNYDGFRSVMVDLNTRDYQVGDEHYTYEQNKTTRTVSADYKYAVTAGRVVEFESGKPVCEIDTDKDYATKDVGLDPHRQGHIAGSTYLTPDNKTLFVVNGVEKTFINVYDIGECKKTAVLNFESCKDERYDTKQPVFSVRSGKLIAVGAGKVAVFNVKEQTKILEIPANPKDNEHSYNIDYVSAMELNAKENMLAVAYRDTTIVLYEIPTGKILGVLRGHELPVTSLKFRTNAEMLVSAAPDGQVKFWHMPDGKELGTLVPVDSTDFILKTPENYYFATKNAVRNMAFRVGKKIFPFEQFDLKYNRPDIVFKQLELASEKQIKMYNMAYKKRLQKAGFTEEMLADDYHLPVAEVKKKYELPLITNDAQLTFTVDASDAKYKLKRLNVYVNDVATFGSKGMSIDPANTLSKEISLNLSAGVNRIQVSVTNEKGVESMRETFEIACEKGDQQPDLYMLVIGVSEYQQSSNNLTYAAKDAKDLAKAFKENGQFANVYIKELTNAEATKENILKEATIFSKTKEEDVAVVYMSGHGLLDEKLNYYLATHDIDFVNPSAKGLAYEELEKIMENIPSRNRLMMIDACHSGEVDKEDMQMVSEVKVSDNVNVRAVSKGSRTTAPRTGLNNSFAYMQALFDDVSKGMGATVISAAGGTEYALESADWNNGVFTYSILNGFKSGEADLNGDGVIRVSELKEYVTEKVIELTQGRQVPNARKQNLSNDFIIR